MFSNAVLIWYDPQVLSISPLSRSDSGGISELARINSLHVSAFTHVSWIPTLLPFTVLGNLSNSPSACFVSLCVYQAVIDARYILYCIVLYCTVLYCTVLYSKLHQVPVV